MTPTVPDGPDTELAAAVRVLREWIPSEAEYPTGLLIEIARDLVRAYFARPAAGRDLTVACDFSGGPFADCTLAVPRSELPGVLVTDVGDSRSAYVCIERNGETVYRYAGEASVGEWEHCPRVPADAHVDEDARPAVARTDGQPPADEPRPSRWLVKDGPDSILGSFATRSAAEEAQERVRPAYPIAWVEECPARSAAPADDTAAPAPVVGYVLARVDDGTVTLWDDDVRETGHAAAVAHVEQVDQPGPWRCYELRDVCIPTGQPVRGSQDGGA